MCSIKEIALKELAEENKRKKIDEMKVKLQQQKWWENILPFTITIKRKK